MNLLLKNNLIQLIHTAPQDLPFITETEQSLENAPYIGQWSHFQHESALTDPDLLHLTIKTTNGQNLGYAILRGLTNPNDSIELMRIVITEKNSSYGKAALTLIKQWCFEIKKAHRLWLDIRTNNPRAQHVYETQGFVREGVLRECVKVDDTWHSLIIMSVLIKDYTPN